MNSQQKAPSVINRLLNTGIRIYHGMPACIRWILWPVRLIYKYVLIFRPDMWIIRGVEKSGGHELILAFAGRQVNKNYLVSLAFDKPDQEDHLGKKWLWKISETAKKSNQGISLSVTEMSKFCRFLSEKSNSFYIPTWISGEIDLSSYLKKDSVQTDIRNIKKNNLHHEVTKKLNHLYNFYYNMLVPQVLARYGNKAKIPNYDSMEKEFKKHLPSYDLLLITKKQQYIAGALIRHKKKKSVRLCYIGVKDGNINYVKDGAIGALYYFLAQYSKEKGLKKFNCGDSRSFLKDGVLEFKKKRGAQIVNTSKTGFLFNVLSGTVGVKDFFLSNPFIYKNKTGLCGALFFTNERSLSKVDLAQIYKKYYLKGLLKLVVYRLGESKSESQETVPQEFSKTITISSAKRIL